MEESGASARLASWLLDFGPFAVRTTGDRLALAAFVLLLFGAWCGMRSLADRPARVLFLAAGGAFSGSLAMRALAIPFVVLAALLVGRALFVGRPGGRMSGGLAAAAALAFIAALIVPTPAKEEEGNGDPATETKAAIERGNLFEARLWGERWVAERPDSPADAALLLAEIDWELGHRARARSIAADVAARSPDLDLRRRAEERLAEWRGR